MTVSAADSTVAELLRSFIEASANDLDAAYHQLVGALWNDGKLTDVAPSATPAVVAAFAEVGADRSGYLAILLGLLAEAEYPKLDGEVATAVRAGLDSYLAAARGGSGEQPLTLALLYLLGHFPGERDRILAVTNEIPMEVEERTRLERSLAELDPKRPDLGRVWPAPSVWKLESDDAAVAEAAVKSLSPQQIVTNWENDTRTVWAYSGAIAYWAVVHGSPAPVTVRTVDDTIIEPGPVDAIDEFFGAARVELLACPTCHGPVEVIADGGRCATCATSFLSVNGILDLSAGVREGQAADDATADLLQKLTEMPKMGLYYEAVLRPAYLRLAGTNFGDAITPAYEDDYIRENLRGVEGPVVDLAAGAGRWTAVVAEAVGPERLTAVDMLLPMLNVLRGALPDVPAVRGSALNLPLADASVGAINLWNALQAFPDDAEQAITEIGRVLRPGGVLTMMTFRWNDDAIARYFQASHFFPSRVQGHLLFELEQLRQWLAAAGLTIRKELSDTGTFVFVTAERTA